MTARHLQENDNKKTGDYANGLDQRLKNQAKIHWSNRDQTSNSKHNRKQLGGWKNTKLTEDEVDEMAQEEQGDHTGNKTNK